MKYKILLLISILIIFIALTAQIRDKLNEYDLDNGFGYSKTFIPETNETWTISELYNDEYSTYLYQIIQFDTALLNETYYMNFMYPSVSSGVASSTDFSYFFTWGFKGGFILTRHDSDSLYTDPYYRYTQVFWGNYVINYKYGDYKWTIGVCIDEPANSQYINCYSRPGQWYGELKRKKYLGEDTSIIVYRDELVTIVDDIFPDIYLQSPKDSGYVNGLQNISILISDNAHASYVDYNINNDLMGDTTYYSSSNMRDLNIEYDFTGERGSEYKLTITAKDAWGGVGLLGNETTKTFSLVNPIYYLSNIYQNEELLGTENVLKSYDGDKGLYKYEMVNENTPILTEFSPATIQYKDNESSIFFKTNYEIKFDAFPYMPKTQPYMNLLLKWNNGIKGSGNKGRIKYENVVLDTSLKLVIEHEKSGCLPTELGTQKFTIETKIYDKGNKYGEQEIQLNSYHLFDRDAIWNTDHSFFNYYYHRTIKKVPNWFHYWRQTGLFTANQFQGENAWYDDAHIYTSDMDNPLGYFITSEPDKYFLCESKGLNYAIEHFMTAEYANQDIKRRPINEKDIFPEGDSLKEFRFNGVHAFIFICLHECGHKNDFWDFWPTGEPCDSSVDYDGDLIPDNREEEFGLDPSLTDTNGDGLSDSEDLQYRQHLNRLKMLCLYKSFNSYDYAFPGANTKWNNPYSYEDMGGGRNEKVY